jgi:sugar fermentation stimulation protein A
MTYENIVPATFISRPNRFIANIELDGKPVVCHVKNTGRCRELLIPGARVLVQMSDAPSRKTPCDLISVWKGDRLINMDAQAPNRVFGEWLSSGGMGFTPTLINPECTHGDSRFDFYFESGEHKCFAEIKGVTLEEDGIVRFPDAPTERGVRHLHSLIKAIGEGYDAYAVFIIQMRDVRWFEPNWATHPAFGDALKKAQKAGVHILALDCFVTSNSLSVRQPVEVRV